MSLRFSAINKLIFITIAIFSLTPVLTPVRSVIISLNLRRLSRIEDWEVSKVLSGDRIIVTNDNEKAVVYLCPIVVIFPDKYDVSKKYLQYLVEKGKLRVNFLDWEDEIFMADVYVRLKPDYQQEVHLNQEMINRGMATIGHHNSPACLNSMLGKNLD